MARCQFPPSREKHLKKRRPQTVYSMQFRPASNPWLAQNEVRCFRNTPTKVPSKNLARSRPRLVFSNTAAPFEKARSRILSAKKQSGLPSIQRRFGASGAKQRQWQVVDLGKNNWREPAKTLTSDGCNYSPRLLWEQEIVAEGPSRAKVVGASDLADLAWRRGQKWRAWSQSSLRTICAGQVGRQESPLVRLLGPQNWGVPGRRTAPEQGPGSRRPSATQNTLVTRRK